jgi:aryl-alcohol dehydrogenase-like predicted oxidoreductase
MTSFSDDATINFPPEEMEITVAIPKRPLGAIRNNQRLPANVSMVAFGCSSFSTFFMKQNDSLKGDEWSVDRLDRNHPRVKSWIETIEYAIDVAGITVFDTAPWYGHGTSEVVVGWALEKVIGGLGGQGKREQLTINTKVGRYEANPSQQFDFSAAATLLSVERSLRRLGCGTYIDVLQLHDPEFAPCMDLLFNETIPAMIECQAKGWCRALGITGESKSL